MEISEGSSQSWYSSSTTHREMSRSVAAQGSLWFGVWVVVSTFLWLHQRALGRMWTHDVTYLYLRRHSPGVGWAIITNRAGQAANGDTPSATVLCEPLKDFYPVLSPSCVAEDSRSGGVPCLPRLWFTSSSADLQFAYTTREVVWAEVGSWSVYRQDVLQHDRSRGAFFARALSKTSNIVSSATRISHVSQP